jgi:dethiobiotin synthetase
MRPIIFITGIGTGVGKTIISAIVTEALEADYCKPVQAGIEEITDSELVRSLVTNNRTVVHPEAFRLKLPASPHIAAREEGLLIKTHDLAGYILSLPVESNKPLIVEGAGGLLVPINENETILDLILALNCQTIIVSRNYLGSINHSLLTARELQRNNIKVAGWIFNDHFMNYENEIAAWTNVPGLGSVPLAQKPDKQFVQEQAILLKSALEKIYY